MSDDHQKAQTFEPKSVIHAPFLQRTQWLTTSIAAVLSSLGILIALNIRIEATMFQMILVVISIGVLTIALVQGSRKESEVDWFKLMNSLADTRKRIEPLILSSLRLAKIDEKEPMVKVMMEKTLEVVLKNRAYVRSAYRVALIKNEKELAADILAEINEYSEWLEKITALLEQNDASNQS